jgi:hypothetical protein
MLVNSSWVSDAGARPRSLSSSAEHEAGKWSVSAIAGHDDVDAVVLDVSVSDVCWIRL